MNEQTDTQSAISEDHSAADIHDISASKRAEALRQEALERLQKIASRVPGLVYQYRLRPDGSACVPFASEAIREIFRVSPEEVCEDASKIFANLHPEDSDGVFASILKSAQDLIQWQHEFRVKFDDGTIRSLYADAVPQREEDGSVLWHGFITDITERKRVKDELVASGARYEKVVSMITDIIWRYEIDAQGQFVASYISPVADRLLGLPAGTIGNSFDKFFSLVYPEDLPAVQEILSSSLAANAKNVSVEYRMSKLDGTMRWMRSNGSAYHQPDGHVVGFGTCSDITQQKEMERRQCMMTEILGILNDPSDLPSAINRILVAIKREMGFDVVAIRLRNGDDFPYFSQNGFSDDFLLTENTLTVRGQDGGICRDKDGNISLECTCGLVLSGQIDSASPIFTSGGSFWTNDSLPLLDLPADKDPRLHPRNRCIHEGYSSVALIPIYAMQEIVGLLQLNDRKKDCFTLDMIHFFEGISSSIGVSLLRKQSEESLRQSTEELELYATALESSNKALEEFNQIAESATRAKSEFLANMSHEIRTPMTAILGYTDLIAESLNCCTECPVHATCTTREANCSHTQVIKRNGEHLLELINDILDFSKVEAGKLRIDPTPCSPFKLTEDVVSLMRVQAQSKQLSLECEFTGPLPETVLTDPLRLRQVLVNLIGNAIKFTDQGKVHVSVRLAQDNDPPRLCFEVSDSGIGMNEEQQQRLFQAFSQVDNSAARRFGGSGLGLCISKRLIEAMGGDIKVRSIPGKGSTFSVTIDPGPLEGIRMVQQGQRPALQPPPMSSTVVATKIELHGRILLAEDGEDNQRLISFILKKAGADVTVVDNGQLAFEAALAARDTGQSFNMILMDMQMPIMDGYTATRELRAREYTGPIIALTAHAMSEDRQKCLDAGCNDYIAKPIDRQKLLATVAQWAAHSRSGNSPDSSSAGNRENKSASPAYVYSELTADPDLGELVEMFVQEMPDRIKALENQANARDWTQLSRTAHQIKGSAGSYGFHEITPYAARLEAAAQDVLEEEQIRSALKELLSLCRRVRSGVQETDEAPALSGPRQHNLLMNPSASKVLLVDDDSSILRLISIWLKQAGFEVQVAADGLEALQSIERDCPDFLIADWEMPYLNGLELCCQMRRLPLPHYVYTLILTGKSSPNEMIAGLENGADEYLIKPVSKELLLARLLAGTRVVELERRLNLAANTDGLTGLMTQRMFYEILQKEWARAKRLNTSLSCVMMDLDFFKRVNDVHGHPTGDHVLKVVADLLTENTRTSDSVCRYGGEEFCVLLPETDEKAATAWAERVRFAVTSEQITVGDECLRINGSFGVAQRYEDMQTPEQLIDRADQALLCAKRSGRDRVIRYQALDESGDLKIENDQQADLFNGIEARHVMTPMVVCLREEETISQAAEFFLRSRINSTPVIDKEGKLVGMLSEKDLMTALGSLDYWQLPVRNVMKPNVISYEEDTPVRMIYEFLCRVSIRRVVIVKDGQPTGSISRATLLRWFRNVVISKGLVEHKGVLIPDPESDPNRSKERLTGTARQLARQATELLRQFHQDDEDLMHHILGGVTAIQELAYDLLAYSRYANAEGVSVSVTEGSGME